MTFEDVKRIRENPTAEDVDNKELARLIDIAIEKQIPKKPKEREGTTYSYCPCCDSNNLNEYCGDCGQALDWGDGE